MFGSDALALRRLGPVAAGAGLDLLVEDDLDAVGASQPGLAVAVVELEQEGALVAVTRLKDAHPQRLVAGFVTYPDQELWRAAIEAGCDLVTTRGTLAKQLPERIAAWVREPGGRRRRLFDVRDVAGRLGVVARESETPIGPVAVYHLGNELFAVQDACPHAGAQLSIGEVDVDGGVVTCPRHGSRFDARSGARLRGPADTGLDTLRIVVEDGQAFLKLE